MWRKPQVPGRIFFVPESMNESNEPVNAPEIDRIFDKLREAEHGSIIKLGLPDFEGPVEAIIFEPSPQRPPGCEDGIFILVPSEGEKVYYLDPYASKEEGRLVVKVLPIKADKPTVDFGVDALLAEFDYIREAPDIKRGGGTAGEACSKAKGIVDVG